MTEQLEGQMSIFDLDIWSGKTYPEPCLQTMEKTSASSLKKPLKSAPKMPLFLDLTASGATQGLSWELGGASLGEFTMHSSSAYLREEDGYVCFAISTASRQPRFYLTLNCGEKPRELQPTKLSDILEERPDEKYTLSAKACQGILNRANRRGKDLPKELKDALEAQVTPSKLGGGREIDSFGKRAEKGALVQTEKAGTVAAAQDQTLIQACDVYNQTINGETAPTITSAVGGGQHKRMQDS